MTIRGDVQRGRARALRADGGKLERGLRRRAAAPLVRALASIIAIGAATHVAHAQQPPDLVKSDGHSNTAMGSRALFGLIDIEGGIWNTAAGAYALENDTAGYDNTAAGAYALQYNTTGYSNTATGVQALQFNEGGYANTAVGAAALLSNTAGSGNTAAGLSALVGNTAGNSNAAFGASALASTGTGSQNTAVGAEALVGATSNDNTAVGYDALGGFLSIADSENTAVGSQALHTLNAGGDTAVGYRSGYHTTTGASNTAVGYEALFNLNTGNSNVAVGYLAGSNLLYGNLNIEIGNEGTVADTETIRIGTAGSQNAVFIAGISGTPLTGSAVYVTANGQLGVAPSSERYKTEIAPIGSNSEKLSQLRPVSFHLKTDPTAAVQYGLIAEEVDKVYPELVIRDESGAVQGVHYEELAPMLLNEMQEQQRLIADQKRRLADQEQALADLRGELAQVKRLDRAMQAAVEELLEKQSSAAGR